MSDKYCFRIELDREGILSGRPHFIYVIAESMEQACEYARKRKDCFDVIIDCKLMGDAP